MRTPHVSEQHDVRTALHWCADNTHATVELRAAAATRLRVLDTARRLHDNVLNGNRSELVALKQQHHDALRALVAEPSHDALREVSDLVAGLDATQQRQLRDVRAAEYTLNSAHDAARRVFASHVDELVHLVALERANDLTACGDDAVPDVVKWVWRHLNFAWHPHWDETLALPYRFRAQPFTATRKHLPLTWADTDDANVRASVAWVWQALAAGDFERVNVPLTLADRQRGMSAGSHGTCLRVTSDVTTLPTVPTRPRIAALPRR